MLKLLNQEPHLENHWIPHACMRTQTHWEVSYEYSTCHMGCSQSHTNSVSLDFRCCHFYFVVPKKKTTLSFSNWGDFVCAPSFTNTCKDICDIFYCHKLGGEGDCYSIYWSIEKRPEILVNILQCKEQSPPPTKEHLVQMSIVPKSRNPSLSPLLKPSVFNSNHYAHLFFIHTSPFSQFHQYLTH